MSAVVFSGGALFDGTGSAPTGRDVLVDDGLVVDVAERIRPAGVPVIDTTGSTLLPGVVDAHVHLTMSSLDTMHRVGSPFSLHFFEAVRNARATVEAGVTAVRDAAGGDLGLKSAIEQGLIVGPRTLISVNMISQTGGHNDGMLSCGIDLPLFPLHPGVPSGVADGPDEVRRIARRMIRAGADQLKVATTGGVLSPSDDPRHAHFQPDELTALVGEADAAGIPVMAHAQGVEGIANAVRAGVRSIEHGIYLDEDTIRLMLANETWLVPTLAAPLAVLEAADRGEIREPEVVRKAHEVASVHVAAVRAAVAAGVRIALGTDAGISPHGDNLREVGLLVACGMTVLEAWTAATAGGAELLGLQDRIGRIAPGMAADVVVLDGAIDDTTGLRGRIRETWIGGTRRHLREDVAA